MNGCESCIHYPPSVMGGKPCGICYPETPAMSFYQKKEKEQKPRFEGLNIVELGRKDDKPDDEL